MKNFFIILLNLLPKNLLSRGIGYIADKKISRFFIKSFAKHYKINLNEIEKDIKQYKTFNDFFTRRLKESARPLNPNPNSIVSPVDGIITQMGKIKQNKLIQAKGKYYSLQQLLPYEKLSSFENGFFITIYLSPTDYHRIHHFSDAQITGYDYIPGYLFPVNPFSVKNIDNLFAINERLATYYKHQKYTSAIIKVGATIVGKISVTYDNFTQNLNRNQTQSKRYEKPIKVNQGDDLGTFEMGSTIILLFEKNSINLNSRWKNNNSIKLNQEIGQWIT